MSIDKVIEKNLEPFNDVITSVTNLGNICSTKLLDGQNNLFKKSEYITSLPKNQSDFQNNVIDTNNSLNDLIKLTHKIPEVQNVYSTINNVSSVTSSITNAIDVSDEGIEDIKFQFGDANASLCNSTSKLVQGTISKLIGGVTQLQRAAASLLDSIANSVINSITGSSSSGGGDGGREIKVLPSIEKAVSKGLLPNISSTLSAVATMNSIVSRVPTQISDCQSLINNINNLLTSNNTIVYTDSIKKQSSINKNVTNKDYDLFMKSYNNYINKAIVEVNTKSIDWITSPYLENIINENLISATKNIDEAIINIEQINKADVTVPITDKSTEVLENLNKIKINIEIFNKNLLAETINIIENLDKDSTNIYEEIRTIITTDVNTIKEDTNIVFDNLIKSINELQNVTTIDSNILTKICSNSDYRQIV